MSTSDGALVAIQPAEKLVFTLKANQENRVKLFIRNVSKDKVAFKVKTTMPTCYFVKPNQDVLGIDGKMGIDIALTKEETMRLVDLAAQGAPEKVLKHRFMVLNKSITTAEYDQIVDLPPSQKAEKFAQIWSTTDLAEGKAERAKQELMKLMLSVEFVYPAGRVGGPGAGARSTSGLHAAPEVSISENVDILRNRLANESILLSDVGLGPGGMHGMMTKEMILDDLDKLKQKLDAMINYTVKLTAERDSLMLALEAAQKERGRERKAKTEGGEGEQRATKKKSEQVSMLRLRFLLYIYLETLTHLTPITTQFTGGVNFPILLGVILIAFFIGRNYRF